MTTTREYGVRYRVFAGQGRLVTREKFFATEKALIAFSIKLKESDGFYEFDSWLYPPTHEEKENPNAAGN